MAPLKLCTLLPLRSKLPCRPGDQIKVIKVLRHGPRGKKCLIHLHENNFAFVLFGELHEIRSPLSARFAPGSSEFDDHSTTTSYSQFLIETSLRRCKTKFFSCSLNKFAFALLTMSLISWIIVLVVYTSTALSRMQNFCPSSEEAKDGKKVITKSPPLMSRPEVVSRLLYI